MAEPKYMPDVRSTPGNVPAPMFNPHDRGYDGIEAVPDLGLHPAPQYRHVQTPRHELSSERLGAAAAAPSPFAHDSPFAASPPQASQHRDFSSPGIQKEAIEPYVYGPSSSASGGNPSPATYQSAPAPEPKVLGLRRTTFFLTLSNIILIIAIILVGVIPAVLNKSSSSGGTCADSAGASNGGGGSGSSPAAPAPTSGDNPRICFDTNTPPRAGAQFGTPDVACPRPGNETTRYTVPSTNLTFTRTCGIDITGSDMGSFPASSMGDCLALCAQLNLYPSSTMGRCLGVSWVFGNGLQGQGVSYCYPKYNVTVPRSQRLDTESAVLMN